MRQDPAHVCEWGRGPGRGGGGGGWPSPQLAPPSLWPGLATLGQVGAVSPDEKQILLLKENQLLGAQPALAFLPCRCLGVGQPLSLGRSVKGPCLSSRMKTGQQSSFSSDTAGVPGPREPLLPPALPALSHGGQSRHPPQGSWGGAHMPFWRLPGRDSSRG